MKDEFVVENPLLQHRHSLGDAQVPPINDPGADADADADATSRLLVKDRPPFTHSPHPPANIDCCRRTFFFIGDDGFLPLFLPGVKAAAWGPYVVDLYWTEKLWLIADYLQLYTVVWNAAQPWPWPYLWSTWTRWACYVNVDIFSTLDGGALAGSSNITTSQTSKWGEYRGYLYYALAFALAQGGLVLAVLWVRRAAARAYGTRWDFHASAATSLGLLLTHLLYLPVHLAVFRLYACETLVTGQLALSADRAVACGGPMHAGFIALCTALVLPATIGLPVLLYRAAADAHVYGLAADQEKRLVAWELGYLFDVDDFWLKGNLWQLSSFQPHGYHFRLHVLAVKLALLLLFTFCRVNLGLQASLFFLVCIAFFARHGVVYRPFRCASSNNICTVLLAVLVVNTGFGMVNAYGIESGVTVSSNEALWLLGFNGVALGLIVVVCVVAVCGRLQPYTAAAEAGVRWYYWLERAVPAPVRSAAVLALHIVGLEVCERA